jgi:RNA polymerase sigma-70 factor (ECF subfamily)
MLLESIDSAGCNRVDRNSEQIYDEFLVVAAITGDRAALARLVDRWQPRLLRHAWRVVGDAERAKDVVQEAWLDILRGLTGLNDVAAFPAWAYRIVTRRCQRSFSTGPRYESETAEDLDDRWPAAPDHESGPFKAELSIVVEAITTLPADQRATLALFYLDELSVAEIAIATDVPPGTVKTRLMHARRKVRAILEGEST